MSRNIFDPFGVFNEWRGQEPTAQESWEEAVVQVVVNDQIENLSSIIADAVYAGIGAERERIVMILQQELSIEEAERVIKIIETDNE